MEIEGGVFQDIDLSVEKVTVVVEFVTLIACIAHFKVSVFVVEFLGVGSGEIVAKN